MKKRTASSEPESSESDSPYEEHNFSLDLRRLCLSLMCGVGGTKIAPSMLSRYEGAPSERTLYSWRNSTLNDRTLVVPAAKRGRPPKFTQDERDVLGGYILFCDEQHQVCGIHEVQDFMEIAFNKKIAPSSVSDMLHEMGFSSHRPGPLSYRFGRPTDVNEAIEFLEGVQKDLKRDVHSHEIERIVAIDQISFLGLWNRYEHLFSYRRVRTPYSVLQLTRFQRAAKALGFRRWLQTHRLRGVLC